MYYPKKVLKSTRNSCTLNCPNHPEYQIVLHSKSPPQDFIRKILYLSTVKNPEKQPRYFWLLLWLCTAHSVMCRAVLAEFRQHRVEGQCNNWTALALKSRYFTRIFPLNGSTSTILNLIFSLWVSLPRVWYCGVPVGEYQQSRQQCVPAVEKCNNNEFYSHI